MINFKSQSCIMNFFLYISIPISTSVSTVGSVALGNSNIDPLISIAKLCPSWQSISHSWKHLLLSSRLCESSESKVWFYKEQCCIGTWNVRSVNQGKLDVVKQEMARVNINISGASKPKWTGMGTSGNAAPGCSLKKDRMTLARFQLKPFSITVIQVYASTTDGKEAEDDWFYEDWQHFLELTPKTDVLLIIGSWNAK